MDKISGKFPNGNRNRNSNGNPKQNKLKNYNSSVTKTLFKVRQSFSNILSNLKQEIISLTKQEIISKISSFAVFLYYFQSRLMGGDWGDVPPPWKTIIKRRYPPCKTEGTPPPGWKYKNVPSFEKIEKISSRLLYLLSLNP